MKYVVLAAALVVWAVSGIQVYAQPVLLSEVSPANASLVDEDGATSDWIELYNRSDSAVNLKGYRIADRNDRAKAWVFPDTTLGAGQYLLVYASDKNRIRSGVVHLEGTGSGINPWNTSDRFYFLYVPVEGDVDISMRVHSLRKITPYTRVGLMVADSVVRTNRHAALFVTGRNVYTLSRRSLRQTVPDFQKEYYNFPVEYPFTWLRLQRKDAMIYAFASMYGSEWTLIDSTEFVLPDNKGYAGIALSSGSNAEFTRAACTDVTLNGAPYPVEQFLTASVGNEVQGRCYESRQLHSSFKLDSQGETLYLWDPTGVLVDSLRYAAMETDVSCGRAPAGDVVYYVPATPGAANGDGRRRLDVAIQCTPAGGIVAKGTEVHLVSDDAGVDLHYTVDGSIPTLYSSRYTGAPLVLDTTCVLRVRAFREGMLACRTLTTVYLVDEPSTSLPVVSLVSNPENFWSDSVGILAMGPNAAPEHPYRGANFWQDREVAGTIQVYEQGRAVLNEEIGIKVQGNGSRLNPQKSLRIAARDRYGNGSLRYAAFPSKPIDRYENLLLRNSGQDWGRSFLRDPLASLLALRAGVDARAYRPARVYLNGQYWGLYNLREHLNEHFLTTNYNITEESIDLLENVAVHPAHGDRTAYVQLMDTLATLDLAMDAHYNFARTRIDERNMIDYYCTEIYAGNIDWPAFNIQYWRSRALDNRWRWIVFDVDVGLGFSTSADFNAVAHAISPVQHMWSNPPAATFLLRAMVKNTDFRHTFINRTADLLNTVFREEDVLYLVDSLAADMAPEIPLHRARWDTLAHWDEEVEVLRDFARKRPNAVRSHMVDAFHLQGTASVTLHVESPATGTIRFSTVTPVSLPWSGVYFTNVPITATAIPAPGYHFVRWQAEGLQQMLPDSATVTLQLHNDLLLTAVFLPEGQNEDYGVVINEIMYKPADAQDSKDWIELYNGSAQPVHLGGWTLRDDDDEHGFVLPSGTTIAAGGYLLLCNDSTAFRSVYDDVDAPLVGNVNFGFGTPSDQVRLYDAAGLVVDSVSYSSTSPWPTDASGTGRSIELLHPSLDNTRGENWRSSGGTPGRVNGPGTSVGGSEPAAAVSLQSIPHPFTAGEGGVLRVQLHSEAAALRIDIADLTGRCVYEVVGSGGYSRGEYSFALPSGNLSVGVYIVRAVVSGSGGEQHCVLPVVVVP